MITIKFSFDTQQEALEFLKEKTVSCVPSITKTDMPVSLPKKRGRPPKKVAPVVEEMDEPELPLDNPNEAPAEQIVSEEVTQEDVREALCVFTESNGIKKAKEILSSFNAAKLSDILERDYVAIIIALKN